MPSERLFKRIRSKNKRPDMNGIIKNIPHIKLNAKKPITALMKLELSNRNSSDLMGKNIKSKIKNNPKQTTQTITTTKIKSMFFFLYFRRINYL
jgi:hypothetical protein